MSGTEERFDRVMEGGIFATEPDDLSAFVADVREAFQAEPLLAEEAHLEAILRAARRVPAASGDIPRRKEGRLRFPRMTLRTVMVKIAVAAVAVVAMFGGLATAGPLPGGLQDGVVNGAETNGVDLPNGDDDVLDLEDADDEPKAQATDEPELDEVDDLDDVLEDAADDVEDEAEEKEADGASDDEATEDFDDRNDADADSDVESDDDESDDDDSDEDREDDESDDESHNED